MRLLHVRCRDVLLMMQKMLEVLPWYSIILLLSPQVWDPDDCCTWSQLVLQMRSPRNHQLLQVKGAVSPPPNLYLIGVVNLILQSNLMSFLLEGYAAGWGIIIILLLYINVLDSSYLHSILREFPWYIAKYSYIYSNCVGEKQYRKDKTWRFFVCTSQSESSVHIIKTNYFIFFISGLFLSLCIFSDAEWYALNGPCLRFF